MPVAPFLIAAAMLAGPPPASPSEAVEIPIRFEGGHFYATPETVDGQALRLVVDTGGGGAAGLYWLAGASAKRLHLAETTCTVNGEKLTVASLPRFKPGRGLPLPDSACGAVALVNPQIEPDVANGDGQLGAGYLPGHVWTFDYPSQRLLLQGTGWRPDPTAHGSPLGFPHDAHGKRETGFARITIRVEGEPLDMLLDTGATAHPTPAGKQASGTTTVNGYGVTSYITTSVLERWHRAHPGWRVMDNGDDLSPKHPARLIRVPQMQIADWSIGPVWFTERPDPAFHEFMSSMMDKRVEGAVGGNVFGHFVMTVDYPREKAWFRCVDGCTTVK